MVAPTKVFAALNSIDVGERIKKKGKLSYLSWAWAWSELKKKYPLATSIVYEQDNGRIYWDDGRTAWVKVGVTIEELEHIEYLPIMDFKNQSIQIDKINSTDVNNSIQRALTKAIARHGLGLYIYAGEDLPEEDDSLGEARNEIRSIVGDAPDGEVKDELIHALKEAGCKNPNDLASMSAANLAKVLKSFNEIIG